MGVGHYENFPVASVLMPARLRPAVRAIYRFARTADDIADEGDAPAEVRIAQLARLSGQLDAIAADRPGEWPDLAAAIRAHTLPLAPFRDLLSAFTQDVTVHRYATHDALLDYCRRSANPIGRLLLALYRVSETESLARSDAICTALQLINFWQDIVIDFAKGRVYIPQSELHRHDLSDDDIAARCVTARWTLLMRALTAQARTMLSSGAPLARTLDGRVGFELRLVVQGGLRILERIDASNGDVFTRRPVLRSTDWVLIAARSIH
jgi:squalene synthase HpnC